jgi:hypothetical protein
MRLAKLEPGSVILFGSAAGTGAKAFFQLDTVFVVAGYTEYDPSNWAKTLKTPSVISAHYRDVVVQHAFRGGHPSVTYRLYRGATFENPIDGMYSFAPARRFDGAAVGFPRVQLSNRDLPAFRAVGASRSLITDNLRQSARCTALVDVEAAAEVWRYVRNACRRKDMLEAVRFDRPAKR